MRMPPYQQALRKSFSDMDSSLRNLREPACETSEAEVALNAEKEFNERVLMSDHALAITNYVT